MLSPTSPAQKGIGAAAAPTKQAAAIIPNLAPAYIKLSWERRKARCSRPLSPLQKGIAAAAAPARAGR
jgi:hypothetical protein